MKCKKDKSKDAKKVHKVSNKDCTRLKQLEKMVDDRKERYRISVHVDIQKSNEEKKCQSQT